MTNAPNAIMSKISKLLALSQNQGATEAEASLAAEHVQRLLQDHGLTLAQVEAAGGAGDESAKREKVKLKTSAARPWMVGLMASLAENNFCLHQVSKERFKRTQHLLVGRALNVTVTQQTYEYLVEALLRALKDHGYVVSVGKRYDVDGTNFLDGAVARLSERLRVKREEREAEDAAKRAAAPKTNGTGRELTLTDVYGTERELNNDALNNFPPGTTAAKRRERDAKAAEQNRIHEELVAEGLPDAEAWYRAWGYSPERAKQLNEDYSKRTAVTSRPRARRYTSSGFTRGERAHRTKVNSSAYQAGRAAGGSIGLDGQVGGSSTKRLGRK
jgi:hypothetical protein